MKKLFTSLLALSVLAGCSSTTPAASSNDTEPTAAVVTDPLIRSTAYGEVKGTDNNGVLTWYGIPYGANPVDDLRWAAPSDPEQWTDVKDCSEPGEMAMQMAASFKDDGTRVTELKGTTDTLNLDVYTTEGAENLPVVVYVHGGNNQTGTSLEIPGNEIAVKDNVVYVSVNYRLGLLGFNCLPALCDGETSTNFGLLDIAKSLEWVKDNIENFGGDPNNVTISGFSAGGRDVMAMLISPVFEGLFNRAVVYSGGMTVCGVEEAQHKIAEIMAPLAVEDGKAEDDAAAMEYLLQDNDEVREYLYSISAERLTELTSDAGIRMAKFPHLFADDLAIPATGFDSEYVNDVPVLMLTGTTEFSLFGAFDGFLFTLDENDRDAAKEWEIKYGSDFYRIFNAQLSAETMADTYKSDMYLCEIAYGGATSKTQFPVFGSFHGIFVPMFNENNGYKSFGDYSTESYQAMSALFHTYFKNFVTTGNPNGENTEVTWEAWNPDTKLSMVFDGDAEAKTASATMSSTYKTNAEIIAEMESDTSIDEEMKDLMIKNVLNGRWFSKDLDEHFNTPSLWQ